MNIEKLIILAECDDKKIRQVIVKKLTNEAILGIIVKREGTIRILDEPIDSIVIEDRPKLKNNGNLITKKNSNFKKPIL
jgi:hypothetical protein